MLSKRSSFCIMYKCSHFEIEWRTDLKCKYIIDLQWQNNLSHHNKFSVEVENMHLIIMKKKTQAWHGKAWDLLIFHKPSCIVRHKLTLNLKSILYEKMPWRFEIHLFLQGVVYPLKHLRADSQSAYISFLPTVWASSSLIFN